MSSRLNELIYSVEQQAKLFDGFVMKNIQVIEGEERPCCMLCGNCPAALLEWLKTIRDELTDVNQTTEDTSHPNTKENI